MSSFDTVIIGAGAAGIAAARRLLAAGGWKADTGTSKRATGSVGRAVTDQSLGVPTDLGAAWLHFAEQNAWTRLADEAGFSVLRREPGWGRGSRDRAQGFHRSRNARRAQSSYSHYHALIEATAAAGRDVSLNDVLPIDDFRARFDATMTWAVGVETSQVSSLDLARYADSDHNWAVREGLGNVVAAAAAGLPVRLGTTVTAIDWSRPALRIDCSSGRIEARSVIITLPTSVLARGGLHFTPSLPDAYPDAFHGLPLGVVNKVFFQLGNQELARSIPPYFIGSDRTSRTCSFQMYPAEQPLLCAYFGGDLSWELEQRGELAHFALEQLRDIFGRQFVSELGRGLTTAWGMDPQALGSYSAALPGKAHCREILGNTSQPAAAVCGGGLRGASLRHLARRVAVGGRSSRKAAITQPSARKPTSKNRRAARHWPRDPCARSSPSRAWTAAARRRRTARA